MTQANMHEAKTKLSQLADIAHSGEVVVIAKAGKPYVDLVPHKTKTPREPGGYDVDLTGFETVDAEIESSFYGSVE
ncbi:MAG: prevent-host-death protein [Hahellaceae bacterium]|nr:prevent-host-death protein [Hahellaceae bacterium]MCP5168357.1 prevent-host-death protein [Hahellaceae bacterium]